MSEADEWIENRIRFKAGKHSLPSGRTLSFDDADDAIQRSVRQQLDESNGVPVLTVGRSAIMEARP